MFLLSPALTTLKETEAWHRSPLTKVVVCTYAAYWAYICFVTVPKRTCREDEMLRVEFGEQWERWAHETPYKIIRYVW